MLSPRTLGINVAVLIGTLLVAEATWRLLVPASETARAEVEFIERSLSYLQPCVRIASRPEGDFIVGPHMGPGQDFAYPRRKTGDVVRIALIGESSGANLGVAMQALLRNAGGAPFEVLNCAAAGASFDHVQSQADEVLLYDPDVVLLVFGHNLEFRYSLNETYLRLLRWRARSRLLTDLTERFTSTAEPEQEGRDTLLERFRGWVEDYSSVLAEREIGLVLTTVVTNLRMPPSFEASETTEPEFLAARFDYADQRHTDAIASLDALVRRDARPLWLFRYGVWLARQGSEEQAYAALRTAAAEEDDRAPQGLNDLLRELAERDGIWLLDVEASTRRVSMDTIPGWDAMDDQCHITAERNLIEVPVALEVAHEAAASTVPIHPIRDAVSRSHLMTDRQRFIASMNRYPLGQGALAGLALASALETWLRMDPDIAMATLEDYLAGETFQSISDLEFRSMVLEGLAFGCWNGEETEDALALNRRARELGGARAWVQLGLFHINTGAYPDAATAFRRALEISPNRSDARLFLNRTGGRTSTGQRPPRPID